MTTIQSIIQGLFTPLPRRPKLTDYATQMFQLQGKLDDLNAALADPEHDGDPVELAREKAGIVEALKALSARQQAAQGREHRDKIAQRQAAFRADLEAELAPLRELLPRLRYHLAGLQQMEARLEEAGESWESLTSGLPFGAAQRLSQAIAREIGDSPAWGDVWTPPLLSKFVDEGRRFAKRQAEQQAAQQAERQAEFDRRLAEFEGGRGPDPRVHTFRVRAG
jgi:DNA repair exonuclease SbcCD ATPase subunit